MIADVAEGAPAVQLLNGKIAAWVVDGEEPYGLLLSEAAASTLAIRLLSKVNELAGDNASAHPVSSVAVDHRVLAGEEDVVRLTFEIEGCQLAAFLDLTQLAELAAALGVASKAIDRGA